MKDNKKLPWAGRDSNTPDSCTREHVITQRSRASLDTQLAALGLNGSDCRNVVNPDRVALALLSPLTRG